MCGLYGFYTPGEKPSLEKKIALLTILAVGNDDRGGDSWGYYSQKYNQKTGSLKKGVGLMQSQGPFDPARSKVLMAHTRKGTVGKVCEENSHPFEIGNIIGAHNGSVRNWQAMNAKYKRDYEVDSMHLFGHLNEGKSFDELEGYGAITWIDKRRPENLNLCKLFGGQLCIADIRQSGKVVGIAWSSEEKHLKIACKVAQLEMAPYDVKTGIVYYIKSDGVLMEGSADNKLELSKGETRSSYKHDQYGHPSTTGYRHYGSDWDEDYEFPHRGHNHNHSTDNSIPKALPPAGPSTTPNSGTTTTGSDDKELKQLNTYFGQPRVVKEITEDSTTTDELVFLSGLSKQEIDAYTNALANQEFPTLPELSGVEDIVIGDVTVDNSMHFHKIVEQIEQVTVVVNGKNEPHEE